MADVVASWDSLESNCCFAESTTQTTSLPAMCSPLVPTALHQRIFQPLSESSTRAAFAHRNDICSRCDRVFLDESVQDASSER